MDDARQEHAEEDPAWFADHLYALHGQAALDMASKFLGMAVRNGDEAGIARWSRIIEALGRLPGVQLPPPVAAAVDSEGPELAVQGASRLRKSAG